MKPNLFIIGAAKCGTNSLYAWLSEHPQVFMSAIKEPNYFCSDFAELGPITDLHSYLALFRNARGDHKVRGEASVNYMISNVAIENIYKFDPHARLIAMLRNPVDVVYAYHAQVIRSMLEDQVNFEVAWSLSDIRQTGQRLPKDGIVPALVNYREIGRLGSQLKRVLSIFPREQLHIVFLDELALAPQTAYQQILEFLAIDNDFRANFPRFNEHLQFRWDWARRIIASPLVSRLRNRGIRNTGMLKPLYFISARKQPRTPLRPSFHSYLSHVFASEVKLLEEITGRDLSHWLPSASASV
jgi:hypothetical protein